MIFRFSLRSRILTIGLLTLSLSLLSLFLLMTVNLQNLFLAWQNDGQISVFVDREEHLFDVMENLNEPWIESILTLKQDEAQELFNEHLQSMMGGISVGPSLLSAVPASVEISFDPQKVSTQDVQSLVNRMGQQKGVSDIAHAQEWVENAAYLSQGFHAVGGWIAIIVVLTALIAIGQSMHQRILSFRSEIEVLELIGATPWSIRRPFVVEGVILSVASLVLALIITYASVLFCHQYLGSYLQLVGIDLEFFSWFHVFLSLVTSAFLGALASFLGLLHINTGWAAQQGLNPWN